MWINHVRSKSTTYYKWANEKMVDIDGETNGTHQQYLNYFFSVIENITEGYTILDHKQLRKEIEELLFSISDNGV